MKKFKGSNLTEEKTFLNGGLTLADSLDTSNFSSEDTKTIEQLSLKLGSSVYYALDSVKHRLVRQTQEAVEVYTFDNSEFVDCIT